jgi:hypothetical protein
MQFLDLDESSLSSHDSFLYSQLKNMIFQAFNFALIKDESIFNQLLESGKRRRLFLYSSFHVGFIKFVSEQALVPVKDNNTYKTKSRDDLEKDTVNYLFSIIEALDNFTTGVEGYISAEKKSMDEHDTFSFSDLIKEEPLHELPVIEESKFVDEVLGKENNLRDINTYDRETLSSDTTSPYSVVVHLLNLLLGLKVCVQSSSSLHYPFQEIAKKIGVIRTYSKTEQNALVQFLDEETATKKEVKASFHFLNANRELFQDSMPDQTNPSPCTPKNTRDAFVPLDWVLRLAKESIDSLTIYTARDLLCSLLIGTFKGSNPSLLSEPQDDNIIDFLKLTASSIITLPSGGNSFPSCTLENSEALYIESTAATKNNHRSLDLNELLKKFITGNSNARMKMAENIASCIAKAAIPASIIEESSHPIATNFQLSKTISCPGAKDLLVTWDEKTKLSLSDFNINIHCYDDATKQDNFCTIYGAPSPFLLNRDSFYVETSNSHSNRISSIWGFKMLITPIGGNTKLNDILALKGGNFHFSSWMMEWLQQENLLSEFATKKLFYALIKYCRSAKATYKSLAFNWLSKLLLDPKSNILLEEKDFDSYLLPFKKLFEHLIESVEPEDATFTEYFQSLAEFLVSVEKFAQKFNRNTRKAIAPPETKGNTDIPSELVKETSSKETVEELQDAEMGEMEEPLSVSEESQVEEEQPSEEEEKESQMEEVAPEDAMEEEEEEESKESEDQEEEKTNEEADEKESDWIQELVELNDIIDFFLSSQRTNPPTERPEWIQESLLEMAVSPIKYETTHPTTALDHMEKEKIIKFEGAEKIKVKLSSDYNSNFMKFTLQANGNQVRLIEITYIRINNSFF